MASAMRKMAVYLGLVEDDDSRFQDKYDSYEDYDEYDEEPGPEELPVRSDYDGYPGPDQRVESASPAASSRSTPYSRMTSGMTNRGSAFPS